MYYIQQSHFKDNSRNYNESMNPNTYHVIICVT